MTPLKIIMESVISSSMAAFDHTEETKKVSICNQRKRKNMSVSHLSIIVLSSFPRRNSRQKVVWCFGFLI